MTEVGATPTVIANCIGIRWSGPPGEEPPPTDSAPGSAFQAVTSSSMVWYGESAGTMHALGLLDQLGDRGGHRDPRVGLVGEGRADDTEAHHHGQVAVALLVHQPRHRDGAAGADDVEDLYAVGDAGGLGDLDRRPGGDVVPAAGAVRHHHPQPVHAGVVLAGDPAAGQGQAGDQHRGGRRVGTAGRREIVGGSCCLIAAASSLRLVARRRCDRMASVSGPITARGDCDRLG